MSFTAEEATACAMALKTAANAAGLVRQLRYELDDRAEEWARAAGLMRDAGPGEAAIETCGAVTKGMRVLHERWGYCRVIRKLNDGLSLQMEHPDDPRGWWVNLASPSSPIVVRA